MMKYKSIFIWYIAALVLSNYYGFTIPAWLWLWPALAYVAGYVITFTLIVLSRLI